MLDKGALPDPAMAYQAQQADQVQKDPQAASLCNRCRYGFRVSCRREWDDRKPKLKIWCTGPWLPQAEEMHGVDACNGHVEGNFSPVATMVETAQKALDMEADTDKGLHIDALLDELEGETGKIEKALEEDDRELEEDDDENAPQNNTEAKTETSGDDGEGDNTDHKTDDKDE